MNKSGANALLEVIRRSSEGSKPTVFTGTVRSVSPLTVETAGVTLTATDLLVNARLLQSNANSDETDILRVGSCVALVTATCDTFILLCKVVKP